LYGESSLPRFQRDDVIDPLARRSASGAAGHGNIAPQIADIRWFTHNFSARCLWATFGMADDVIRKLCCCVFSAAGRSFFGMATDVSDDARKPCP